MRSSKNYPAAKNIYIQLENLALCRALKKVLLVFTLVATGWLIRGLINKPTLHFVTDSSIAIAGALLLFMITNDFKKAEFLLDRNTVKKISWDVMILFSGGFAMAKGFASSGLIEWMTNQLISLRAGIWLNIVGRIFITLFVIFYLPFSFVL